MVNLQSKIQCSRFTSRTIGSWERLGQASVVIARDTYCHVSPGLQEEAALKFEEGLRKAAESQVAERI